MLSVMGFYLITEPNLLDHTVVFVLDLGLSGEKFEFQLFLNSKQIYLVWPVLNPPLHPLYFFSSTLKFWIDLVLNYLRKSMKELKRAKFTYFPDQSGDNLLTHWCLRDECSRGILSTAWDFCMTPTYHGSTVVKVPSLVPRLLSSWFLQ